MKKLVIGISLFCALIVGCGAEVEDISNEYMESMFVKVENGSTYNVVYHNNTKVMFVISKGGYNAGNFQLLVNEKGDPLIWDGNGGR